MDIQILFPLFSELYKMNYMYFFSNETELKSFINSGNANH